MTQDARPASRRVPALLVLVLLLAAVGIWMVVGAEDDGLAVESSADLGPSEMKLGTGLLLGTDDEAAVPGVRPPVVRETRVRPTPTVFSSREVFDYQQPCDAGFVVRARDIRGQLFARDALDVTGAQVRLVHVAGGRGLATKSDLNGNFHLKGTVTTPLVLADEILLEITTTLGRRTYKYFPWWPGEGMSPRVKMWVPEARRPGVSLHAVGKREAVEGVRATERCSPSASFRLLGSLHAS